ncbi:hypothetical protein ACWGPT_11200 [Pseudorhizobium sp. NPDC055634]
MDAHLADLMVLLDVAQRRPFGCLKNEKLTVSFYGAVTDGTDRLRDAAGADAAEILSNRVNTDCATFFGSVRALFGL